MAHEFLPAKTLERRELWQGNVGTFGEDDIELSDGRRTTLALLKHPGAAAVVPFLDDRHVLLLRQYRYAAGATLWEIPAGKLDAGESPEHCARRELEEETGYNAERLISLGTILTTPGFTDEVIHLYAAFDLKRGTRNLDADESIETAILPFDVAVRMACDSEISDGKSVAALLRAHVLCGHCSTRA